MSLKKDVTIQVRQAHDTNVSFLLDKNTFLNTIKSIQYYYKRNLVSDVELPLIAKEMEAVIENFEKVAQTGENFYGTQANLYLSYLDIDSYNIYANYDGIEEIYTSLYSIYPVRITNPAIYRMQKKWMDSLMKNSTLITRSNESLQVRFFNKQRQYLDNITSKSFFSLFENCLNKD